MTKMTKADEEHPDNKKLQGSEDFKGPIENRKCTDVIFCLLILASWLVMTVVGFYVVGWFEAEDGLQKGNPWRLINGMDYEGRICGVHDEVKDYENLYSTFEAPDRDEKKVCVKKCPTIDSTLVADEVVDAYGDRYESFATKEFINYCLIEPDSIAHDFGTGASTNDGFEEIVSDIWTASGYIGGFGLGGATLVAFLYLLMLRIPGLVSVLVWGSVLVVFAMVVAVGVEMRKRAQDWDDAVPQEHTDTEITLMNVLSVIFFIFAFLYVCLIVFLRKRITLAMGILKEAARCVGAMPLIMCFPLMQALGAFAYVVVWVVYTLYLASSGEITTETVGDETVRVMNYTDDTKYALLYMLFQFFWTTQFIIAFGQIVISVAVASWYFSRDKSSVGSGTVLTSIKKTAIYHTGTAAFGSLLIAIVKTIRVIISYLQKKASASQNKVAEAILCCLQCCFWCLEKCLKFLNKNAYTQTAIFAVSFCSAARRAFFLILRNIARVGAVTMVGTFVMSIGKLFICVVSAGAAYLAMQENIDDELYGLMAPSIMTALLAFMVAHVFMDVYDMAVTTILQCFLADEEMFSGDNRFAQNELRSWVDAHGSSGGDGGEENGKPVTGAAGAAPPTSV